MISSDIEIAISEIKSDETTWSAETNFA